MTESRSAPTVPLALCLLIGVLVGSAAATGVWSAPTAEPERDRAEAEDRFDPSLAAVKRREELRRSTAVIDDLTRRIQRIETAVRRLGEIGVAALAPAAEHPAPQPPAPTGASADERVRPYAERLQSARARYQRTAEKVLPGSPILAREAAEVADAEAALQTARRDSGVPLPAPSIAEPPAATAGDQAALAARLAALTAAETRDLQAFRDQRDAAVRERLALERAPVESHAAAAEPAPREPGRDGRIMWGAIAGGIGFAVGTLTMVGMTRRPV